MSRIDDEPLLATHLEIRTMGKLMYVPNESPSVDIKYFMFSNIPRSMHLELRVTELTKPVLNCTEFHSGFCHGVKLTKISKN